MWETVELREIRVFLVIAEELHFGRSAQRLGVSPSRVSQTVRQLEAKLGGKLVHRTSRIVRLTAFGERFQEDIGAAHEQIAGVLERTEAAGRSLERTLHVGLLSAPAGGPHFFRIVGEFEARHPECTVRVDECFPEIFEPLRRGDVKLLATWLPHGQPGLTVGPMLACEPRVLAVGPEHPLAGRTEVSLEDVGDYATIEIASVPRELHEAWIPSTTPSGRRIPRQRSERISISELAYLVVAGRLVHPTVASAPKSWGHPDIVVIPITDMPPLRSALVWQQRLTDQTALEFARVAREVLAAQPPTTDGSRPRIHQQPGRRSRVRRPSPTPRRH